MNRPDARILLLEDDPAIAKTVVYALERAAFSVTHSLLVRDALRQMDISPFDLLLLDVGLPDGSGLDVCRAVRANAARAHLPILMLSAQGEEIDRVLGLELGADDYVTKPYSPRELVARVRALLRRAAAPGIGSAPGMAASSGAGSAGHPRVLASGSTGALEIDAAAQRARLRGQWLPLTRREFGLLAQLLRQPGRIYSREALLDAVWGPSSDSTDRTVDTHIKTLRAKLQEAAPEHDYIETHRGMGYAIALPLPASGNRVG
jgi:two-component system catabolic regulation response regulator CreB